MTTKTKRQGEKDMSIKNKTASRNLRERAIEAARRVRKEIAEMRAQERKELALDITQWCERTFGDTPISVDVDALEVRLPDIEEIVHIEEDGGEYRGFFEVKCPLCGGDDSTEWFGDLADLGELIMAGLPVNSFHECEEDAE